ncbi:butyrate kinase [Desulforhopalus sp. 52FAK]
MFDLDKSVDKQLGEMLSESKVAKPVIVFPEASDPRIIAAASGLLGVARIVLLGDREEIRALCDYKTVEFLCSRERFFSNVVIIEPKESPLVPELAAELCQLSEGRKWQYSLDEAFEKVLHPVIFGAMLVRQGYADASLGGVAYSTKDFLAPCLRLIKSAGTAFEMGLFVLPEDANSLWEQNIVMFADVALNLRPSAKQLADIAIESCKTLRDIVPHSVLPNINGALISYSTKGSGQGPSVETIREAEPLVQEKLLELQKRDNAYESISITAELQISVAVSKDAAKVKLKDKLDEFKGAGEGNVLIVPTLDEGNMLYHLFNTQYPGAKSSLIMGGMNGQVLDYSRGSSVTQIIRGAKLLLLTRMKSTKPLAAKTPLFPNPKVLTIVPGYLKTEVSLFEGDLLLLRSNIDAGTWETDSNGQSDRLPAILNYLASEKINLGDIDLVITPGGMLENVEAGCYYVNEKMLETLEKDSTANHPINIGPSLAYRIALKENIPVLSCDSPTLNQMSPENMISGLKGVQITPFWHALSQRQVARMYTDSENSSYEEKQLIIAHIDQSGVSVGSHRNGKCINVNDALFDGPMSLSGVGSLSTEAVIELCYSGYEKSKMKSLFQSSGGLSSYLGSVDFEQLLERAEKDDQSSIYIDSLVTGISSEIFSRLADFSPNRPDQIILTGSLCYSEVFVGKLIEKLEILEDIVTVYPGSFDAEALRDAAFRFYKNIEKVSVWSGE